jgi:hypothetical protein
LQPLHSLEAVLDPDQQPVEQTGDKCPEEHSVLLVGFCDVHLAQAVVLIDIEQPLDVFLEVTTIVTILWIAHVLPIWGEYCATPVIP